MFLTISICPVLNPKTLLVTVWGSWGYLLRTICSPVTISQFACSIHINANLHLTSTVPAILLPLCFHHGKYITSTPHIATYSPSAKFYPFVILVPDHTTCVKSSPISEVWNDPSHRFKKREEIIPPYTWVEATTSAPHIPGCTLNSDYTFDPSVCWKVPPSTTKTVSGPEPKAYVSETVLILRENQCDYGQTELKTTQSDTNTICTTTIKDLLMSFYEQASIIDMSTNDYVDRYRTICVPPSLEKYLPGPSSCILRYQGTQCPDGHTPLSIAAQTSMTTSFCCSQ